MAPAVIHRSGVVPAVTHGSALASLLGERTAEEVPVGVHVGLEERKTHEQD